MEGDLEVRVFLLSRQLRASLKLEDFIDSVDERAIWHARFVSM